jgi:signal transduction histidine kinase
LVDDGRVAIRFAYGDGAPDVEGQVLAVDDEEAVGALKGLVGAEHCELAWLRIGGERVGLLAVCGGRSFDDADRRLLDTFSSQAAIAVANAKTFGEEREKLLASAEVAAARAREKAAEEGLRRAIAAQEAERARIARELHDETGQVLTALAVQLRALEGHVDDAGRSQLTDLRAQVKSASTGLRSLATELRPSGLREHGLAAAIARHADRVYEISGIRVDSALDALPPDLTEELQIAVFRVVQEALTNVARHSGAGRASVLATCRDSHLRVVVEDDGAGFDPTLPTGRLGIAGMHERMELLGGELRIESSPGSGAAVVIDLEVAKP